MEARDYSELLTKSEYAQIMRVSAGTVDEWVAAGKLKPAIRTPGGHQRFYHPLRQPEVSGD